MDNPLELISSSGVEAMVELWNDGGKLVLAKGWDEFASMHTKKGALGVVLFEYVGQNKFNVTFFGEDGTEVQTISNSDYCTPLSFYIPYRSPTAHVTSVSEKKLMPYPIFLLI